jgi:hypothetical protein
MRHALSQARYAEDVARARAAIVALREQITHKSILEERLLDYKSKVETIRELSDQARESEI